MPVDMTIHYDNTRSCADPYLWVWCDGSAEADDFVATGTDAFGPVFRAQAWRPEFRLMFKDGPGGSAAVWEDDALRCSCWTTPTLARSVAGRTRRSSNDVSSRCPVRGRCAHVVAGAGQRWGDPPEPADRVGDDLHFQSGGLVLAAVAGPVAARGHADPVDAQQGALADHERLQEATSIAADLSVLRPRASAWVALRYKIDFSGESTSSAVVVVSCGNVRRPHHLTRRRVPTSAVDLWGFCRAPAALFECHPGDLPAQRGRLSPALRQSRSAHL
jgi:hypothetical protein